MKERGIIFNAEMLRAILDGRKTQTRRIIKPQPELTKGSGFSWNGAVYGAGSDDAETNRNFAHVKCPYGQLGDRLWVRETWQAIHDYCNESGNVDERRYPRSIPKQRGNYWHPVYAESWGNECREDRQFPWRPAIHMPRWASRITLEITGVRVERLNSVSEEDAQREGVQPLQGGYWKHYQPIEWTQFQLSARGSLATLWNSIYGDDSWWANLWVWVVEFKRVEQQP
ncbi:hypothetical protein [Erwinia sp. S38]|uniref:hypothetical protein n=1 Tax=Erwinia sp. S38 TaxID=2769338 RepID=UPI0019095FA0|nr:hypothetical protein [Erwinia sp. S38]MBK0003393.1 hypothetical protein [Erwinia sp. S38]